MTNLEKMKQLTDSDVDAERVKSWAYANRITVDVLAQFEPFDEMEGSVEDFCKSEEFIQHFDDESKLWDIFLDRKFIPMFD